MKKVQPLSVVKARLSEVVRTVRETREPVVVTVDGEPVVEIGPVAPARGPLSAEELVLVGSLTKLVRRLCRREQFDALELLRDGRR
jgi:prevent-host-death family protein